MYHLSVMIQIAQTANDAASRHFDDTITRGYFGLSTVRLSVFSMLVKV